MWEEDPHNMKEILIDSFKTRFASSYTEPRQLNLSFIPSIITENQKQDLLTPLLKWRD